MEEEIRNRIILGNKAYYANKSIFVSRLATKNTKFRLYQTMIRPVVTFACETWTLKKKDIKKLLIFERKILRKIFGPKKCVDGTWTIRTNDELNKIIKKQKYCQLYKSAKTGLVWSRLQNE
ncbi:hypothetical protein C0J52_21336 [Blattella germanica]|nr:hypothetical protein C0J52_21336 [Blattella germanica]PSN37870.1 hypothetical protein C0J52_21336 [Blattella germanica]PSN37871.1 hypothetical protein C0J52_21336 [Blattella germanica]